MATVEVIVEMSPARAVVGPLSVSVGLSGGATATAMLKPIPNPAAGMMKRGTCAARASAGAIPRNEPTAMISQRFVLDAVPDARIVPEPTVTLRPRYGMPMTLRARERQPQR